MKKKSKFINPEFKQLIPEYSDEEIINILKKRKYYQKEAAELAIKEAIERNLIHSEQDLFSPEFNKIELKKSFFPIIEDQLVKQKVVKSITRVLLIAGVLPFVWGIIKFNNGSFMEGGIIVFYGILWIFSSTLLNRKVEIITLRILAVLVFISFIYLIKIYLKTPSFTFMDVFIPVVIFGLVIYGLVYLYRLK